MIFAFDASLIDSINSFYLCTSYYVKAARLYRFYPDVNLCIIIKLYVDM